MPSSRGREPVSRDSNEGEGSRTAARRYQAGVKRTIQSGRVEQSAQRAAKALDGKEGAELRRAEAKARTAGPSSARRRTTRPTKH